MELSELAQIRLVTIGVILIFVAIWTRGIVGGRRRQAHFVDLARSFGGKVTREGKFLSRFPVEIDGRTFDVRFHAATRFWRDLLLPCSNPSARRAR